MLSPYTTPSALSADTNTLRTNDLLQAKHATTAMEQDTTQHSAGTQDKMQHRARATLYWPGIDVDIVEYVQCCKTYIQHKATQHIQPMIPRDVPEAPWQDLTADFFTFKNKGVLISCRYIQQIPFHL